jgi:hypothetical protein
VPVWSIVCVVVRGGHRRKGVTARLIVVGTTDAVASGFPRLIVRRTLGG